MNAESRPRRVAVILTYRGAYARLKTLIEGIRDDERLELQLIVGGSALLDKFGQAIRIIEEDGFPIAARLRIVMEGEDPVAMAKTTGIGIMELTTILDQLDPNVAVVIADRYETMGCAIVCSYLNIPLVHVQGGEVSGSIDEKIRHAITKFADYHFVANEDAARRVERMGEEASRIFVTGCPSIDVAAAAIKQPLDGQMDAMMRRHGVGPVFPIDPGQYLVVVNHPVTTEYEDTYRQIEILLDAVHSLDMPTLWLWPNVDAGSDLISKGIRIFREKRRPARTHFFKNLPPEAFYRLLHHCAALVGSSSVGIRESAFLGVPVVNVGERQHGRLRGSNVHDVPWDADPIVEAIRAQTAHGRYPSEPIYGDGKAGARMVKLLAETEPTLKRGITY